MTELEEKLGYEFRNPALLDRALTTPACRMSNPQAADNQRLEFLGDAVFGLLSADAVFAAYPDEQEGRLTVRRTHLVSGTVLAEAGERIGLEQFLKRNAGAHPLPPHAKVIADTMEAVMGAVWLDGGLAAAQGVFARLGLPIAAPLNEWAANPKGYLQVRAQAHKPPVRPTYETLKTEGPSHAPVVTVRVTVEGLGEATATAGSKTAAEIAAAAALLQQLDNESAEEQK